MKDELKFLKILAMLKKSVLLRKMPSDNSTATKSTNMLSIWLGTPSGLLPIFFISVGLLSSYLRLEAFSVHPLTFLSGLCLKRVLGLLLLLTILRRELLYKVKSIHDRHSTLVQLNRTRFSTSIPKPEQEEGPCDLARL